MSFQQGLSGLNVSAKALDAIGNNIANSNTVGFKSSQTQFADVYAASLAGGGAAQVGIGASLANISQQFTQGNVTATNNPLDLAINGSGMFRLSNNGVISYTRNGQYQLDKSGYIVANSGLRLTGYAADATGAIVPGDFVDLQVSTTNIEPKATSASGIQVNLDSRVDPPASMTSASFVGAITGDGLVVTAVGAANEFDITVDGAATPVTVTIPAATYDSATLQSVMNTAINDALEAAGQTGRVSVTLTTNGSVTNALQITSTKVGDGSSIVLEETATPGTGATAIFGGVVTTGSAVGTDTTPTFVVGEKFLISVDGGSEITITLTAAEISAATLETAINGALAAGGQDATVTVAAAAGGNLVISSGLGVGDGAAVTLKSVSGDTGYADLFGPAINSSAGGDNFSTTNVQSYTASTAQTVYDSLGNAHNMTMYFVKVDTPGLWNVYLTLDGLPSADRTTDPLTPDTTLSFNSVGTLTSSMPLTGTTFNLPDNIGAVDPLGSAATIGQVVIEPLTIDFTGTTQYGISFGVNNLIQDGYTSGRLAGLSVSSDGILQGRYSNGKTRNMGQLVLANFNNPNGLQSLGGNMWSETAESGSPVPGTPGQGSLGVVQSGSVEESNVDLTAELVAMITMQRSYQANAQTVKTMDQVLQTLVNLR